MYGLEQGAGPSPASGMAPMRAGMAQAVVAHVYDVTLEEMRVQMRGAPHAAMARQVAMYLSHVVFGMSVNEIAAAFMRHRSTAHYALRHVEDLRDDAEVDLSLKLLEMMLVGRRT